MVALPLAPWAYAPPDESGAVVIVDTPQPPPDPLTTYEKATEEVGRIARAAGDAFRMVVTGQRTGRLRRKALFVIAVIGTVANASVITLVALLLLAMTDDSLVDLT